MKDYERQLLAAAKLVKEGRAHKALKLALQARAGAVAAGESPEDIGLLDEHLSELRGAVAQLDAYPSVVRGLFHSLFFVRRWLPRLAVLAVVGVGIALVSGAFSRGPAGSMTSHARASQAAQAQSTSDSVVDSSTATHPASPTRATATATQPASPTQANDGNDVGCVSPVPGESYCGQEALDWCNQNAGVETYVQGMQCESVYNRDNPGYVAEPPCRQAGGGPDCALKYCQIYSNLDNTIGGLEDVAQNYNSDETLSLHTVQVLHRQASEMGYSLKLNQPPRWQTQFSHLLAIEADATQVRTLSVGYAAADQQANKYGQGALADTPAPLSLFNTTQNDGNALDALSNRLGDETKGLGSRC